MINEVRQSDASKLLATAVVKPNLQNVTPVSTSVNNGAGAVLLAVNPKRIKAVIYSTLDVFVKVNNVTIGVCKSFGNFTVDFSSGEISVYNAGGSASTVIYIESVYP